MPVWGFVLAMFAAALWAVSPILIKIGLRRAGPNEISPIRSIGYLATMLIAMNLFQPGVWPAVPPLLLLGLTFNVATSAVLGDQCYIYAINKIGASLAVSIASGYPLISTVFSIWLLDEKITPLIWTGTVIIIAGLVVIRYSSTPKGGTGEIDRREAMRTGERVKGISLALFSAFCTGANMPFLKMLMVEGNWNPVELYFIRSVIFTVIVWGVRFVMIKKFPRWIMPLHRVRLRSWLALIAGGSLALAVAGMLYGYCIRIMPVSVVTPITASSPFFTVMIARVFYHEKLSRLQNIGVVMVIAGSVAVSL